MYDNDDLQRIYDEGYFSGRSRPAMWKRRAEFIIEKFSPRTVLDVGCASGELVKALDDLGVRAFGIDGSDFAVSHADSSIKNKVYKVNLNSDPFPFEANTFDLIAGFYSIEHIHNTEFFAKELYRTLKKDGKIWFLTPNEGVQGRNETDVFTNRFEDWKKIFQDCNFKVSEFNPFEMMALRGKLEKFKFYKLPSSVQNIIKYLAYNYANRKMNDTSFLLEKS